MDETTPKFPQDEVEAAAQRQKKRKATRQDRAESREEQAAERKQKQGERENQGPVRQTPDV